MLIDSKKNLEISNVYFTVKPVVLIIYFFCLIIMKYFFCLKKNEYEIYKVFQLKE